MVKQHISQKLLSALEAMGIKNKTVEISTPSNFQFGDYSSNIAMQLSKELQKNPLEIATALSIRIAPDSIIEKVEAIKPGFINFSLRSDYLIETVQDIIQRKEAFGQSHLFQGKKVIIEYTDPNPFKEFHIGHLYSNIVGESLVRLHKALGADVKPVCYQGDVGMHVAKSLWGMFKKMQDEKLDVVSFEAKYPSVEEKIKWMGHAYALGATAFEEDPQSKQEITEINKKVYAYDPEIVELYKKGRQWSLDYFEKIYQRLGTKFEHYFFESEVGPLGLKYVKENITKGIFKESEGAIVFDGEQFGLHTRVFINSLGLPTYEAKDLGLAPTKYEWFPYDLSIIVTANEVDSYFKVVIKALSLINPELGEKTKHISHGVVRLPEGKMSSRTGKVITGEWLLDTAHQRAWEVIQQATTNDDLKLASKTEQQEDGQIAEAVGIAAIKYALLKNNIGKNVEFNFEESVSFEGNSGPYLQYTYVRCRSVLAKHTEEIKISEIPHALETAELDVLRTLEKFPGVVETAAKTLSPNLIGSYLFDLAQKFNVFYQKNPILKAENSSVKNFRLILTTATAQVIHNGLYLLGIKTVEKM